MRTFRRADGPYRRSARRRGFTLVEVLVALFVMALLSALAWQGLGTILRARDATHEALDKTLRLNTGVAQWEQDLQAVVDPVVVPPLTFNGQALVLTRRADTGVVPVVWAVRSGLWQRWAGPTVNRAADLQEAWIHAQGLLGNETGQVTVADKVTEWQLYKYIAGRKTNMQSSGNLVEAPAPAPVASGAAAAREALPEAVEMVLTIDGRTLTRLIAIGPGAGG